MKTLRARSKRKVCRRQDAHQGSKLSPASPNEPESNGDSTGSPQHWQIVVPMRENDSRHSPQIGNRLARISGFSHNRQPAGIRMLTTASLASLSQRATPPRIEEASGKGFPAHKAYPSIEFSQRLRTSRVKVRAYSWP